MKNKYIAKKFWKDHSTPMGAVDKLAKQYDEMINLSLGDPDVITHEDIIQAAFEDAKQGHTKYTDFRGDPELRAEIVKYYKKYLNASIEDEQIMVTTSACLGMFLAMQAIVDPQDEVIIHSPYFTPYFQQIELAGGVPVELETLEEGGFQIDFSRLEATINERTKALVINSPNNPTGAVFSRETLQGIAQLAKKHDLVIISDEIYGTYTYGKEFISMIEFEEIRDQLIILNSFSKDYTMTGWRLGHMIAPKDIIKTVQQVNENVVFTAPSISQRAGIFALRNKEMIQETFVQEYKDRVLYAAKRINEIPWMSVREPEGTFYLFINIKKTGKTSAQVSERILSEARVLTIPGNAFGTHGEGYIRIACTVGIKELEKAFDSIKAIQW